MRIGYVSPLPPQRTGVADYSDELLPFLARYAEIELFVDGYDPSSIETKSRFPIRDVCALDSLDAARSCDALLYHIGNSNFHADAYRTLARLPGISVLHDYFLHHAVVEMTVAEGDPESYVREMGYSHGLIGADTARAVLLGSHRFPYLEFPVNRRVLDASLGIIVHSNYVRSLIHTGSPGIRVTVVPHHVAPVSLQWTARPAREALQLDPTSCVFASFGLATAEKRLDVVLRAFCRVFERFPTARYLIVGELPPSTNLPSLINRLGLNRAVDCIGYVDKDEYLKYIAAADVGVNLRWPTMGETSGSLLRLLAAGKPTIVSDVGSFGELPDDCCRKIPVGETEDEVLASVMLELAEDPEGRAALGQRARQHVTAHHAVERCAELYFQFIRSVVE